MILKDGKPNHSLGSPGNVHCTAPHMISNVLDYSYDPYAAAVLPRMLPMHDDFTIQIETRIPEKMGGCRVRHCAAAPSRGTRQAGRYGPLPCPPSPSRL